jgi:hypothetical protein
MGNSCWDSRNEYYNANVTYGRGSCQECPTMPSTLQSQNPKSVQSQNPKVLQLQNPKALQSQNLNEFQSQNVAGAYRGPMIDSIYRDFKRIDVNNDGVLSFEEIKNDADRRRGMPRSHPYTTQAVYPGGYYQPSVPAGRVKTLFDGPDYSLEC